MHFYFFMEERKRYKIVLGDSLTTEDKELLLMRCNMCNSLVVIRLFYSSFIGPLKKSCDFN